MSTQTLVAWWVGLLLIVCGLSHAARPREWVALFRALFREPWGGLAVGLPTIMAGLGVLLTHQVWEWSGRVIVTVIGWGWTVKGTLYLVWPDLPRRVSAPHLERPQRFRWAGLIGIALGAAVLAAAARA